MGQYHRTPTLNQMYAFMVDWAKLKPA